MKELEGKNPLSKKPFLATTALEEFWDTSREIVFIGEECCRYSRRQIWEPLGGKILPSPWEDPLKREEANRYCKELYEIYLLLLGNFLNKSHGENHSQRYWRILIGPWLNYFLKMVYERYTSLKGAFFDLKDFDSLVLDEAFFRTPENTYEFRTESAFVDLYNLQIYSRIFTALGKYYPSRAPLGIQNSTITPQLFSIKSVVSGFVLGVFDLFFRLLSELNLIQCQIILQSSYFPFAIAGRLFIKSRGKVSPLFSRLARVKKDTVLSNTAREELKSIGDSSDPFEKVFSELLFWEMPKCFLEDYRSVKSEARKYPDKIQAIFSATSWYFDEPFKFWAAQKAEGGVLLLGTQHGGNYGSLKEMYELEHELSICDHYYSWGWAYYDKKFRAEVRSMPATKLCGRKRLGVDNGMHNILLGTNCLGRFWDPFAVVGVSRTKSYFQDQFFFVGGLHKDLKNFLKVRLYQLDFGWDTEEMWRDLYPGVVLEKMLDIGFMESLKGCRIYVCDHLATTFAESLAANKPTILFWDPSMVLLTEEAQPYYDSLREVGILHYSPQSAAEKVNEVYEDVEKWWKEYKLQRSLKEFKEQFIRTSDSALDQWQKELSKISNIC